MDCRQAQPKIADYSVGLLRAREQEQVANHLTACATCEREWRQFQAVIGLVERHGSREPPPHLWNGVYNRITADVAPASPGFWERLFGRPRGLIAGTATGIAAAALLVALMMVPPPPSGDGVPRPVPAIGPQMAMAVQRHAMLSGAEPFADQVGLEAYALLVKDPKINTNLVR
jgi:anti-sigma factor RsiW